MNRNRRWAAVTLAILLLSGCSLASSQSIPNKPSIEPTLPAVTSEAETMPESILQTVSKHDAETENAPETESVSIAMVGDILLHTPVEKAALQADGTYQFNVIFEYLRDDIQAADMAIVNQEVIIGGEELGVTGYPQFNAPFAIGDALVNTGFDVVCHGTNHALDKGKKGLLNCLEFWNKNYPEVAVLGIHDSQESQDTIYVYEKNGIRIAVLNFTYGTNGIDLPDDMPYAVDLFNKKRIPAILQKAEELADFTIVCPHWGQEYQLQQSSAQETWAMRFVENGVDLVIGTHPHVIQPIEWVIDEKTGNQMLVYYSLGNFVNWTSSSGNGIANRMVGGMAQITLTKQDGEVIISDYGVEPVVCHLEQGTNGVTVYKLAEYTEELATANQIRLQDPSFSLDYCKELCETVWDNLFP